jgi:hypothetical protein
MGPRRGGDPGGPGPFVPSDRSCSPSAGSIGTPVSLARSRPRRASIRRCDSWWWETAPPAVHCRRTRRICRSTRACSSPAPSRMRCSIDGCAPSGGRGAARAAGLGHAVARGRERGSARRGLRNPDTPRDRDVSRGRGVGARVAHGIALRDRRRNRHGHRDPDRSTNLAEVPTWDAVVDLTLNLYQRVTAGPRMPGTDWRLPPRSLEPSGRDPHVAPASSRSFRAVYRRGRSSIFEFRPGSGRASAR